MTLIKNRLSGRAHQLPADLRGCSMSNNTMSVTTFALSAPLEDGAYSKKENIFKIEASLLSPPPGFSCNFKALVGSLEVAVFLLQSSQEGGQVGDLPSGTDHWDQLLSGSHENILISKEMPQRGPPTPLTKWKGSSLLSCPAPTWYPEGRCALPGPELRAAARWPVATGG